MSDDNSTLTLATNLSYENDNRFVAKSLPLFSGSGSETRYCGNCAAPIARNVSVADLYANLQGHKRVVVTCVCGAHNLLVEERRQSRR